jgi:PIN domain nuclease of toxin-antitoxin system
LDLLPDTQAFLWWIAGDPVLSQPSVTAIGDTSNRVVVSAASAWEIATKVRIGKLPGAATIATDLASVIEAQGFVPLSITLAHAQAAGALPGPHKDPFDRMLTAQAMLDRMILVSNEQRFDSYGVTRLW